MENTHIKAILKHLPISPGVYKMKDAGGKIIYVGKAKNLRNRVRSYFQNTQEHSMKTQKMVSQIDNIEYTVVGSELEALLLETNVIKELRPKYNVLMKDDKNYVYVRVTTQEDYPRITIVRKVMKDKARYFGPKTAAYKVRETFKSLKSILPFRHCNLDIKFIAKKGLTEEVEISNKVIRYPCLDHYIKRCVAPCIGNTTREEYRNIISKVIDFFEGKTESVIEELKSQMHSAAAQRKFEKAGRLRDKLKNMEEILERQRISDPDRKDTDIINYFCEEGKIYVNLFQVREGKLLSQENFILDVRDNKDLLYDDEILESFLRQYYEKATDVPKEVLIPIDFEEKNVFEEWLSQLKGQKVTLLIPQKGEKNKLLELSLENAKSYAKQCRIQWLSEGNTPQRGLEELMEHFKLQKLKRMECYDISHLGGTLTVASMVVFENGVAKKEDYRTFKIRTLPEIKPDDFLSMNEVLQRRLKHLASSASTFRFAEPNKKDLAIIGENIAKLFPDKKPEKKTILTVTNDKKQMIAYTCFHQVTAESAEIFELWIDTTHQRDQKLEYDLLRKLIEKQKYKKYYIWLDKGQIDQYEVYGFQESQHIPETFIPPNGKKLFIIERKKLFEKDPSLSQKPDLIIIDGGKGQLSAAQKAMHEMHADIPMVSLAKREEEIFQPGQTDSIRLGRETEALKLVQRIRDEAHRFAITFQRELRGKAMVHSALDEIPGIGDTYRKNLLKKFGSLANIKKAKESEIAEVVGEKLAKAILGKWKTQN